MEPDKDLNPDSDDLPLRANTNHILVRHYVLNLTVHIDQNVISGSIVLFLEPCPGEGTSADYDVEEGGAVQVGAIQNRPGCTLQNVDAVEWGAKGFVESVTVAKDRSAVSSGVASHAVSNTETIQSSYGWESTSDGDFTLVLDCCDLDVSKVEEVDVTSVSSVSNLRSDFSSETSRVSSVDSQAPAFIQSLIAMPSSQWREKHKLFLLSSHGPPSEDGSSLYFYRDTWSLQVRKKGIKSREEFPRCLRIFYKTKPMGRSVRWTKDQDNRFV